MTSADRKPPVGPLISGILDLFTAWWQGFDISEPIREPGLPPGFDEDLDLPDPDDAKD